MTKPAKALEWEAGIDGFTFYHPYTSSANSGGDLNDYDIENVHKIIEERCEAPLEEIKNRIKQHQIDTARNVKRSYGSKVEDNFSKSLFSSL